MKWSRINSQRRFLIPNTVKMIIETIIQLPSSALSKSQWMALIRVRSSHSPATEQLWPPPHTNQHKCCQSKTVLFQKVKLCFFLGTFQSPVMRWCSSSSSPDGVAEDPGRQPLSKLVSALCALFESDNAEAWQKRNELFVSDADKTLKLVCCTDKTPAMLVQHQNH